MVGIEIGNLWPFGKKVQPSPPLSCRINLSDQEKATQRVRCANALVGDFTLDRWRQYVDGMARVHGGAGYFDGTVFAEVSLNGDNPGLLYFQTNPTTALIRFRCPSGTEIIAWGNTHDGRPIETPILSVLTRKCLDLESLRFKPDNPIPKKSEKCGNLAIVDYEMSPETARGYCGQLLNQTEAV